ncbi:unnamed protein product [Protopolystoma xenopodis]|uniref:Uncharacterized protein n=1 Tax=Protopolystoma xenopodis TaxID=117903 RepID=A0A448X6E8_9PLAT|nr:unnamed protein product [Protopolystoma xenopodis]
MPPPPSPHTIHTPLGRSHVRSASVALTDSTEPQPNLNSNPNPNPLGLRADRPTDQLSANLRPAGSTRSQRTGEQVRRVTDEPPGQSEGRGAGEACFVSSTCLDSLTRSPRPASRRLESSNWPKQERVDTLFYD